MLRTKDKLERIWNKPGVRCPSNICIWSEEPVGWRVAIGLPLGYVCFLYVRPGKRNFRTFFYKSSYERKEARKKHRLYGRWFKPIWTTKSRG